MSAGILCKRQLQKLIEPDGGPCRLSRPSGAALTEVDASSLDLPIAEEFWEMRGSCRTGRRYQVSDIIRKYAKHEKPKKMSAQMVLKRQNVYLFKVDCAPNLDEDIQGKSTARSSIGRLDVLVRLLIDEGTRFDCVPAGYSHNLYVEVAPITFDLVVQPGTCLSQLRLFRGGEHLISLTKEALQYENEFFPVVDREGKRLTDECKDSSRETGYPFCLDLTPDPHAGCSGFVAKPDCKEPIDPSKKGEYDPTEFWEPVYKKKDAIELEPDRLYILRSKERLRLPAHLALECQAYTETMGEWRIEYAGFAHPYFGHSRSEGAPLMFEVRGHNIPTILTDGIPLGNVIFKRMSKPANPPEQKSQYEDQELRLSNCFKPWPQPSPCPSP